MKIVTRKKDFMLNIMKITKSIKKRRKETINRTKKESKEVKGKYEILRRTSEKVLTKL